MASSGVVPMLPPYLIGLGLSRGLSRRDDRNTADGGRLSRIDVLMEPDLPASPPRDVAAMDRRSRMGKIFRVTAACRQGGDGLYEPDKE